MFKGHDLSLLGDIHKPQFLDEEKTMAYAGSLIQQNHGEGLTHGIMVWDLETKKSEFVEIVNDYGYYTFHIDEGKITNPNSKVPLRPRLRFKVKDTDSGTLKQIIAIQELQMETPNKTRTNKIFQLKSILKKCRERGKFDLAVKLTNKYYINEDILKESYDD